MYIFDCEWCNLYIWTPQRGSAGEPAARSGQRLLHGQQQQRLQLPPKPTTAAGAASDETRIASRACMPGCCRAALHACRGDASPLWLLPCVARPPSACSVPRAAGQAVLGPAVGRAGRVLVEPRWAGQDRGIIAGRCRSRAGSHAYVPAQPLLDNAETAPAAAARRCPPCPAGAARRGRAPLPAGNVAWAGHAAWTCLPELLHLTRSRLAPPALCPQWCRHARSSRRGGGRRWSSTGAGAIPVLPALRKQAAQLLAGLQCRACSHARRPRRPHDCRCFSIWWPTAPWPAAPFPQPQSVTPPPLDPVQAHCQDRGHGASARLEQANGPGGTCHLLWPPAADRRRQPAAVASQPWRLWQSGHGLHAQPVMTEPTAP